MARTKTTGSVLRTRTALYVRVSTKHGRQTTKNQERELRAVAQRHGWEIVSVFRDRMSGAQDQRPGLKALLEAVTRKEFDRVAVWSTDRLGRSMPQLVRVLETLKAKGIALYDHRNSLDTSTPMGQAFYYMSGIFAEIERTMIVERIHAGLKRAKAEGKRLGRPTLSREIETRVKDQLAGQVPIRKVALALGIAPGSVLRIKKEMATG
jgi:DNA invertase Pin-like site-specific DNA recombinase